MIVLLLQLAKFMYMLMVNFMKLKILKQTTQ